MELFEEIIENIWVQRIFWAIVVILINLIIYGIIARFLNRKEERGSRFVSNKKNKTYVRMAKSLVGAVLAVLATLTILQIFGVDVTSMVAGLGIISVVVGLALQDIMKDIFRGFNIISDGYFHVGDIVKIGGVTGQVLSIKLRTTRLKDVKTQNIISISNHNIDTTEVVSGVFNVKIPLPYELKLSDAKRVLGEIEKNIQKIEGLKAIKIQGVDEFDDSAINYQIEINCEPIQMAPIRREALKAILETLEKYQISIPYNQLEIRKGE